MSPQPLLAMLALATIGFTMPATARAQISQIIDASGDGAGATLSGVHGVAVGPNGDVYVSGALSENVFKVTPNGTVSLFASLPNAEAGEMGVDAAGNVFVQDHQGAKVYKISPSGTVKVVLTVVGDGGNLYQDGEGLAVGANGVAYAAGSGCTDPNPGPCPDGDEFNNVFRISPSALPELVLDKTAGGLLDLSSSVYRYQALAVDPSGNLYASTNSGNAVLKVTPANQVSIAISFTMDPRFFSPVALTTDAAGNMYVVTEANRIFRVTPTGAISELSFTPPTPGDYFLAMATAANGALYLSGNTSNQVVQFLSNGITKVILDQTGDGIHQFRWPDTGALAVDAAGNVYAAGSDTNNAFKIIPEGPFLLTSAQQKCVNGLNGGMRKVAATQAKDVLACVRDGAKGALGPMTVDACVAADRKGKVQKARAKVRLTDTRACTAPRPAFGATSAAVVNASAMQAAKTIASDLLGASLEAAVLPDVPATHAGASCQAAVLKSLGKCEDARLGELVACKKAGLKTGAILTGEGISACLDTDAKGKIAKACDPTLGSVRADLDKCTGVDLQTTLPGRCAASSAASVAQCLAEATRCRVCRAAKNGDALTVDCDVVDDGQTNGSCVPICGDGFLEGTEECDDSNVTSEDGCSSACVIESCGDTVVQAGLGEGCDDGNNASLDGCDATCHDEFCGDGITNDFPNELCDGASDALCPGQCQPNCSCAGPITVGTHQCSAGPGSFMDYHDSPTGHVESPLVSGSLDVQCGQVDGLTGRAPCTCSVTTPLLASELLNVCLLPTGESCATGEIDCDGGDALDVELVSDHDIGSCTSHTGCAAQCDAYCGGSGGTRVGSTCEGHCVGGPNDGLACTHQSVCPSGQCLGFSPISLAVSHPDTCGCHCRTIGGNPAPSGGLSCQVAVEAVVELSLPCGDGDVMLRLGKQCLQLTSQVTNVTLLDTNHGTVGPFARLGAPKTCTDLAIRGSSGLQLTGAIDTIHGSFENDTTLIYDLVCQ